MKSFLSFFNEILNESELPDDYSPKQKGTAYKVFRVKNGKLYPPMVANPGGKDTPIGKWLEAEEGEFAGLSKTGRKKVKSIGSGKLAYRPGWHLGEIPRASQFDRTNKTTGEKEFPADFVWAECDYVMDINYQKEAEDYGYIRTKIGPSGDVVVTRSKKFQHSLAGLPKLPKSGFYRYRTNPNPETVPWVITGAIKVKRLLDDYEVNEILKKNGINPIHRQGGDKTLDELGLGNLTESIISEGKHWPEDYEKLVRKILSELGETVDVENTTKLIFQSFKPLSHVNQNFPLVQTIAKWFVEYVKNNAYSKDQYFNYAMRFESVLPELVKYLINKKFAVSKTQVSPKTFEEISKDRERIKNMSFKDFYKGYSDEIIQKASEKTKKDMDFFRNLGEENKGKYVVDPIFQYSDIENYSGMTGGDDSEWCHTSDWNTFEEWTDDGSTMFILRNGDYEDIENMDYLEFLDVLDDEGEEIEERENSFDDYGISLIAIRVSPQGKLLNATTRWNHAKTVKVPSGTRPTDFAIENLEELEALIGKENVEEIQKIAKNKDEYALEHFFDERRGMLDGYELRSGDFDFVNLNKKDLVIEDVIAEIGADVFSGSSFSEIVFEGKIEEIGENAFYDCPYLEKIVFEKNSLEEIQEMENYPFGLENPEEIIKAG